MWLKRKTNVDIQISAYNALPGHAHFRDRRLQERTKPKGYMFCRQSRKKISYMHGLSCSFSFITFLTTSCFLL